MARSTLAQAALVAALTAAGYSIGLASSPPHLTHDEIKFALQAKSIADTGRDLNGRLLPLYFIEPGFSVGRDPICIYVTAAVLTVLPLSESSMRLATALVGGLGVGLVFVLARLLFERAAVAWAVAGILALSPTYYIHGRLALSVLYPIPFTIGWLIALHRYLEHRRAGQPFVIGAILGLGVYSYLAAAVMMPLYLGATIVVLSTRRDWRAAKLVALGFAALMLPLVLWQAIEPERYANILAAYRLYEPAQRSLATRALDLVSPAAFETRAALLWDAFNPSRLFFTGESSIQISTREVGSLLTPVALFLGVGLWTLRRLELTPVRWLLVVGLVTAPLPGVIMGDVEIRRWLVVVPFVAVISGIGIERWLSGGRGLRVAVVVLLALSALQFAGFTRDYFGRYRERSSTWFGGNIRAALERVLGDAEREAPSLVYISTDIPWVEAYWRFYVKVHSQESLLERTRYVRLQSDDVPAAAPGAVLVAPQTDDVLAAKLAGSGWTSRHAISDLDGSPSLTILAPAPF